MQEWNERSALIKGDKTAASGQLSNTIKYSPNPALKSRTQDYQHTQNCLSLPVSPSAVSGHSVPASASVFWTPAPSPHV